MIHWLRYAPDKDWASAFALNVQIEMDIDFCVQAYVRGIWDKDMLYRAFFSRWELKELVAAVSAAELRTPCAKWSVNWHAVEQFFGPGRILEKSGQLRFDRMDASMPEKKLAHELYEELISLILKAELRRGEEETVFSKCISQIQVLYGADTLVQILKALGKEPLKRSKYGLYGTDRQTVFCQLLRVCHPREGDCRKSESCPEGKQHHEEASGGGGHVCKTVDSSYGNLSESSGLSERLLLFYCPYERRVR